MRKIYIFLFAFIAMTMTAFAQDAQPVPVVKLSGEQIGEYPYELPEEDADKIFALETVTVAVKVTTPDVLNQRFALFCTSDPTQNANTVAMPNNSAYVGYGISNQNVAYLASARVEDRNSRGTITTNTEGVVLVYVLNPTTNMVTLYLNGELADPNAAMSLGTYTTTTPKMVKNNHANAGIYIGGGVTLEGSREVFTGTIEGVEVYDGELTAEQIAALFPEEPVVVPTKYTVDVRSAAEDWGTVAIEGHDGTSIEVEEGTEITVVATPAEGYVFESWNDEQGSTLSTDATYTFAVNAATTVVAWFAQAPEPEPEVKWYRIKETAGNQYMNVYSYDPSVEDTPYGLVNVADYNEEGKDQIFTLEETGTDGQYYLHTEGGYYIAASTKNGWNVNVSQSSKMAVIFEETTVGDLTTYTLRNGDASGNNYFKVGPVDADVVSGNFVYCDAPAANKATWVLEEVSAVAPAPTYEATVRSADETMGTAAVEVVDGVATFTATALEGYKFTGWIEGTATVSTENPYTVTLSADIELIATFEAAEVVEPGFDWKGEYTVYATVTNETDSWTCPEPITMVIGDYTDTYVTTTVIKSFMGIDLKAATGGQGSYPNLNFADDGKSATIYVGTGIYLSQELIMEGGIWSNCNFIRAKDKSTSVTLTVDENGVISIPDLEIFNDILHDDFATHDITVLSTLTGVTASKGELPEPVEPVAGAAITSVDQLNSAKCYIITSKDTGRGAMYAGAGATRVDMCGVTYNAGTDPCHSVAVNAADPCQQFAFVEFNGKYYLYSVSEKKFLAKDGDVNKLTNEEPFDYVTITKEADAGGDYFSLFINDANYITASPGWCSDATRGTCLQTTLTSKSQNDGWDNGAWFTITEIDNLTFDPAEALAILNTPKPEYFTIERVTPAAGVVTELRNITVIPSVYSLAELPTDWTITDADNNSYPVTIDWGMSMYYDVMVMLQEPITAPGTYTLTIPEGSAEDDYGKIVEAATFTWTIEAPEPEEFTITGYTPDAAVESIKTITITFSHDVKATDMLPATDQFPLYKGAGYIPSYMGDWSINGNVLTITFAYEVNEAGTYTVRIPEGLFERVSDGADFAGQNIDFVVTVTDGIDAVGAEDGEQVIYDLTGRKIEKITGAGIYIINGVKKIVK